MDLTNVKPVFSIILPLSAAAPSPTETVNSILSQTYKAFELLIVTDGTEIPELSYILQRAQGDKRIRLLSARSEGLRKSVQEHETISPVSAIQALQTIYDRAVGPRRPDSVVIGFLTSASDRTDLSFSYPAGFYSRETLEKGVFPYMVSDRRKKYYSASPYPALFNRVTSRKLLLRHYCREVRVTQETAHAYIHECLLYSESAYFISDPLYIRTVLPWGRSYAADYFTSNMHLINYLTERFSGDDIVSSQLPFLKAHLLLNALKNTAESPAPVGEKTEHLAREIRDTFALSDIDISALPPRPRFELSLLKGGHYRAVLTLAEVKISMQGMKGKLE